MVKKKPAAQAKTAENETVKVETKAAEKTTAAEKEAVKEVAKEVVKETAAAEEAPAKAAKKEAEQEMILQFGGREIKEKDLYERIQQIWIKGYGKKAE